MTKKVTTHIGNTDNKSKWLKMKVEDAQRIYDSIETIVNALESEERTVTIEIPFNSDLENSLETVLDDFEESWRKL